MEVMPGRFPPAYTTAPARVAVARWSVAFTSYVPPKRPGAVPVRVLASTNVRSVTAVPPISTVVFGVKPTPMMVIGPPVPAVRYAGRTLVSDRGPM